MYQMGQFEDHDCYVKYSRKTGLVDIHVHDVFTKMPLNLIMCLLPGYL